LGLTAGYPGGGWELLFQDHFVGVVRRGHPLASGEITASRYAACGHVVASRRGLTRGPVDDALEALGLQRRVIVVVPSFPAALAISATSDLVGLVTSSFVRVEQDRMAGANGMPVHCFALPVQTSAITVSQMWHPRVNSDPAHCWLREIVLSICRPHQMAFGKSHAIAV
jgi:DNA-binding transcriptional LysR family regulator